MFIDFYSEKIWKNDRHHLSYKPRYTRFYPYVSNDSNGRKSIEVNRSEVKSNKTVEFLELVRHWSNPAFTFKGRPPPASGPCLQWSIWVEMNRIHHQKCCGYTWLPNFDPSPS